MSIAPRNRSNEYPDNSFIQPATFKIIGVTGFKPATSGSQIRRSISLSYTPVCPFASRRLCRQDLPEGADSSYFYDRPLPNVLRSVQEQRPNPMGLRSLRRRTVCTPSTWGEYPDCMQPCTLYYQDHAMFWYDEELRCRCRRPIKHDDDKETWNSIQDSPPPQKLKTLPNCQSSDLALGPVAVLTGYSKCSKKFCTWQRMERNFPKLICWTDF